MSYLDSSRCQKVDLYAANDEGITPLHDAAWNNRAEVCRLLLKRGGNKLLSLKTSKNNTPLDLATSDETRAVLFLPIQECLSDSQEYHSTSDGLYF